MNRWLVRIALVELIVITAIAFSGSGGGAPFASSQEIAPEAQAREGNPLVAGLQSLPNPGKATRIVAESIGLDSTVVDVGLVKERDKWVWDTAAYAVGHSKGTANPGQLGNVVLAGHISSPISKKGNVFKNLPKINVGDQIKIYTETTSYTYQVVQVKVVEPKDTQVMAPTRDATATLITCYPDWNYSKRLVVVAKLVNS